MNCLDTTTRAQVIRCLIEGCSIRSTVRMTGAAKNTVVKLLGDMGAACAAYHDKHVRNLMVRRLQADEIWSFVGAKSKRVTPEQAQAGWGDIWTWVGLCADTKLVVSYHIGDRGKDSAYAFMQDCSSRIVTKPQITTDSHKPYLKAVEAAFGSDADYAMMHKIYGTDVSVKARYTPATCIGCVGKRVSGNPDPDYISTSYVERQNLSMRMGMRRFTRLTNGFSKKVENHIAAIALHYMHYNYCRIHQTLRVTPAMEAGLSNHVWGVDELIALLPKPIVRPSTIDRDLLRRALGDVA